MSNLSQTQKDFQKIKLPKFSFKENIFKTIASYNDEGSYADELLKVIFFLLIISCGMTLGLGFLLHKEFFTPYVGTTIATITAFFFTLFIEYAKIKLGWYSLRIWVFGMARHGIESLAMAIFVSVITIGGFYWSYHNSTVGVDLLTKQLATYKVPPKDFDPAPITAQIDEQIAQAQKVQNDAMGTKWRGTTTVDAQRTAKKQSAVIELLQSQRGLLLTQALQEHAAKEESRNKSIDATSFIAGTLGGRMEFFQLLFLLVIVMCEKVLHRRKDESTTTATAPLPSSTSGVQTFMPTPASDPAQTVSNTPIKAQIGFEYGQKPKPPTVIDSPEYSFENTVYGEKTLSNTVEQPKQPQTLDKGRLIIASVEQWKQRHKQCLKRSETGSDEAKKDNTVRAGIYAQMLLTVGYRYDNAIWVAPKTMPNENDIRAQIENLENELRKVAGNHKTRKE